MEKWYKEHGGRNMAEGPNRPMRLVRSSLGAGHGMVMPIETSEKKKRMFDAERRHPYINRGDDEGK